MGCCCSRYSNNDEQRDARTPLLQQRHYSTLDGKRRNISRETSVQFTKEQEEEVWKSIIDRTSKLMIDNNSYPSMNPLHPSEIEARQKKYANILNRVRLPPPYIPSKAALLSQQQDKSTVVHILEEANPYGGLSISELNEFTDQLKKIEYAKNQIDKSLAGHSSVVVPMKKINTGRRTSA